MAAELNSLDRSVRRRRLPAADEATVEGFNDPL
jgi:hypothetical protein